MTYCCFLLRGEFVLDLFYIGIVIVFFVLMWAFTKAAERL